MADRNEVFRIILEGRDRLSKELDSVRGAADKLDQSLQKLKRNKPEEFPLFGGGKGTRGQGGQFIKKEELRALDVARQKVEALDKALYKLRRGRIKDGEIVQFGGGRSVRGDDGRFIRPQDVTLLDKAKARLDAIDKTLVRIQTRAKRGPLGDDELPGFGGSRVVKGQGGQFVRAQDLTLVQRFGRELVVLRTHLKGVQTQFKQGFLLDADKLLRTATAGVVKLDQAIGRLVTRLKRDTLPGFGGTRVRRGEGGQFVRVEDISLINKAREGLDKLQTAFIKIKRGRLKEGELFGAGGTRLTRNEKGQFVKVEDISLIERAKKGLEDVDNVIRRIKTRVKRGPLFEGETGFQGKVLTRGEDGQFTKAQDITILKRLQREFIALGRTIKTVVDQTKGGILRGLDATVGDIRRVEASIDRLKNKLGQTLLGRGRTRTGVNDQTGQFISVPNPNTFGRFVDSIVNGSKRIVDANNKVADSVRRNREETVKGFKIGLDASRETKRRIDEKIKNSREEIRNEKDRIKEQQELDKIALTAEEDRDRAKLFAKLEAQRENDRITIRERKKDIARAKAEGDIAEKERLEDTIAAIQRNRRIREKREGAEFAASFQKRRADQRIAFTGQLRGVDAPDIKTIEKEEIERRTTALKGLESGFQRMGAKAGLAFGDILRGAQSARKGIKDTDRDIRLLNNAFTRFGFAIGSVFKNFGQLVNLRWLFLTGILSTFFTLLVQIGTALVAVAASAIQAGAALGGAFLSGVAQALPVVGLLAAALNSFNKVLDQVKLNEKLDNKVKDNLDQIRDAGQRLADAQYSLKKALEGVGDAQVAVVDANKDLKQSYKDLKEATKDLADAKVQAARDIVDANLEEKDAALSLAEAELGVLEAKKKLREEQKKARGDNDVNDARAALKEAQERLQIAKAQADQSEISSAQQQVTLAEQNLNAILDASDKAKLELKDAELGVKRAVLTVEQARVRNNRAQTDAAKARKEGVAGSDVVTSAQKQLKQAVDAVADSQRSVLLSNRNVRDSLHQVAVAQREVAEARKEESDARKGQSQADKDAQAAFADLAPAEKKLFGSLQRLRKVFKDVFTGSSEKDGILGPITEAIARFADTLTNLLLDPKIQKAASTLAQSIAEALDSFSKFVGSADFKEALLFFTEKAADNIPRIVEGMLNLTQSFLDIAKAANPIFDRLIDKAVGLTGRLRQATSQGGEVRRPEEGQRGVVSTINESGLDRFLGSAEKHLDSWLRLSASIINLIAAITGSAAAGSGETLIGKLTDKLNEFAEFIRNNPESVQKFFDDAVESITNLTAILGRLTEVLVVAFSSDEMQAFAQIISEIVIPGLVFLIFVLGKLSQGILFLLDIPIVGDIIKIALSFLVFEKGLNKLFPVTQKITEAFKKMGKAVFTLFRVLGVKGALEYLRLGFMSVVKAAGAATAAVGRFIFAMGKAFLSVITSAAKAIGTLLVNAFRALKISVRSLLIGTGIGALILAGVLLIENWDKVKKYAKILGDYLVKTFKKVVDWFRDNWKKVLIALILAPFLIGGAVLLGIYKFRDKILGVFTAIKDGIIGAFRAAFKWVRTELTNLGSWIGKKLKSIPIIGRLFGGGSGDTAKGIGSQQSTKILNKLPDGIQKTIDKQRTKGVSDEDILSMLLEQGIITREQFKKAVRASTGRPVQRKGFAVGGTVPGSGRGDTVPAMLTPGEWVLNDNQQREIARRMGVTVQQAKAMIFGTKSDTPPRTQSGRAPARGGAYNANAPRNNGLGKKVQYYGDFNLVSQTDPDGVEIWFIEMNDGSFGQVTSRDALKIQKSSGTWIPNYVKRNSHGFKQNIQRVVTGGISGFSMGGVVGSPAVQRFAKGGIVQKPGFGGTSSGGKVINQNFDVKTQGETDWGYVMRLGAIHAQESF